MNFFQLKIIFVLPVDDISLLMCTVMMGKKNWCQTHVLRENGEFSWKSHEQPFPTIKQKQ